MVVPLGEAWDWEITRGRGELQGVGGGGGGQVRDRRGL